MARTAILLLLLLVIASRAASPFGKGGATPGVAGDFAAAASLADAYDQLAAEAERVWCLDEDAAFAPLSAATNFTSLRDAYAAIAAQATLLARIADSNDPLDHLERYEPALRFPGLAPVVYNRAYGLIWQHAYARAQKLFCLLVAPTNPDGFSRGSSYYWLGFLLAHYAHDPAAALPHLLSAHRYPACLVFIDAAGREAADIYYTRGLRDIARAVLAQQIPSIDYWKNDHKRAARGFDIAYAAQDATNIVRNLLRMASTTQHVACAAADLAARRSWVADLLPPDRFAAIAAYLTAVEPWPVYQAEIISRALAGPEQGARDPALTDFLLHDWPEIEVVADAFPVVLTNRTLSNNIFPQRRRAQPLTPLPAAAATTNIDQATPSLTSSSELP